MIYLILHVLMVEFILVIYIYGTSILFYDMVMLGINQLEVVLN